MKKPKIIKTRIESVDEQQGVVLVSTNAADRTVIVLQIDGKRYESTAFGGLAFIRTGRTFHQNYSITIV
jgi:hypothetical protein